MSDTNFPDYTMIKAMAQAFNRPAHSLYVLSRTRSSALRSARLRPPARVTRRSPS